MNGIEVTRVKVNAKNRRYNTSTKFGQKARKHHLNILRITEPAKYFRLLKTFKTNKYTEMLSHFTTA